MTFEVSTGQFGRGLTGGFQGLHLLLHPLERRHGGIGTDVANSALQLLLGLGRLGPGLKHVLFGFGLGDLALEGNQALLQGLHLAVLRLDLGRQGCGGFLEGLTAGQRFPCQVFLAFLERELRPLVPGGRLGGCLLGLAAQPLLAGNCEGNGLTQFHQVRLHVGNGLIENLGWILHAADGSIGVGAHQAAQPVEEAHLEMPKPTGD